MLIASFIYKDFWGTDYFQKSLSKFGYSATILRTTSNTHEIMKSLFELYRDSKEETFIYIDSADSVIQKEIVIPNDRIIYQTEKACFPFVDWASKFESESRWKFLNGGGYCGNRELIVEFFQKYGLYNIENRNPQAAQQEAYLDAKSKGFPIFLDTECEIFQSIAFDSPDEFAIENGLVKNLITGTTPQIIHGNGRTPMEWVYKLI